MNHFFKDIFNLFYPNLCLVCANELVQKKQIICLSCRSDIPVTNFSDLKENMVEFSFYGRVPVEAATSLLYFSKKGMVQKLIHQLKYKNQEQIGSLLGDWLGDDMMNSGRFKNIDCIVPVPLHTKKFKKRGYNQVTKFGESLALKLNVPMCDDVLIKVSKTKTQTFKKRMDRWGNIEEKFMLSGKNNFQYRHILLIDDVITTGATLESCCIQLLKIDNIKISIATMAYTD